MKVQHLNTVTFCPIGGSLLSDKGIFNFNHTLVTHCLLVESNDGLVLIDTGFGTKETSLKGMNQNFAFLTLARPKFTLEETALYQITKAGFKKEDVRHIILTHLDVDHAGGITDFPQAKVHFYEPEYTAALSAKDFKSRERYKAAQFPDNTKWVKYNVSGESWEGFSAVRALEGISDDIYLVPLDGHTAGHAGVAV